MIDVRRAGVAEPLSPVSREYGPEPLPGDWRSHVKRLVRVDSETRRGVARLHEGCS